MEIIALYENSVSNPAVVAEKVNLEFENPVSPKHLKDKLDDFLPSLTALLRNKGCTLIGHIKGVLNNEKNEHIFFSITGFEETVRYKEQLTGLSKKANLVMNVIVYGIDENTVQSGIRDELKKCFGSDGNKCSGLRKAGMIIVGELINATRKAVKDAVENKDGKAIQVLARAPFTIPTVRD